MIWFIFLCGWKSGSFWAFPKSINSWEEHHWVIGSWGKSSQCAKLNLKAETETNVCVLAKWNGSVFLSDSCISGKEVRNCQLILHKNGSRDESTELPGPSHPSSLPVLSFPPWSGGNPQFPPPFPWSLTRHSLGMLWRFSLLRNTRKCGRTPEHGKKRWPNFSARKGDTGTKRHRCVSTNGICPPKTPFPVCWTTKPRQKKHLVLQGLFFRLIKEERSSFTTKTTHPSSTHLLSSTLCAKSQRAEVVLLFRNNKWQRSAPTRELWADLWALWSALIHRVQRLIVGIFGIFPWECLEWSCPRQIHSSFAGPAMSPKDPFHELKKKKNPISVSTEDSVPLLVVSNCLTLWKEVIRCSGNSINSLGHRVFLRQGVKLVSFSVVFKLIFIVSRA